MTEKTFMSMATTSSKLLGSGEASEAASAASEEAFFTMPSCMESLRRQLSNISLFHVGCCAALSLQNSSYVLLRRYQSGVLHEASSAQSILAVGELIKLAFSILMVMRDAAAAKSLDVPLAPASRCLSTSVRLASTSAKMAVPALIFLTMNLLSFVALNRISAAAFSLIQQSKIAFTAILARLLLGRVLSQTRWRALLTLTAAVLIICQQTGPAAPRCATAAAAAPGASSPTTQHHEHVAMHSYVVGVLAVALEALLSGLSNVYFEMVLKTTSLTLWERNVQLAVISLLIYVPMAMHAHPAHILTGWTYLTLLVAVLGAIGGILIGLVLKYCDSIIKNLSLSTAIVTTSVLDSYFFAGPMNLSIVSAGAIVLVSILNYTSSA